MGGGGAGASLCPRALSGRALAPRGHNTYIRKRILTYTLVYVMHWCAANDARLPAGRRTEMCRLRVVHQEREPPLASADRAQLDRQEFSTRAWSLLLRGAARPEDFSASARCHSRAHVRVAGAGTVGGNLVRAMHRCLGVRWRRATRVHAHIRGRPLAIAKHVRLGCQEFAWSLLLRAVAPRPPASARPVLCIGTRILTYTHTGRRALVLWRGCEPRCADRAWCTMRGVCLWNAEADEPLSAVLRARSRPPPSRNVDRRV